MLSLLHCSDVHLDTPMTPAELRQQDARFAALRATFSSMMQYIRGNGIRLLLIAGDLFNNMLVTHETVLLLRREFASVPDCHIVIAPGLDDACTPSSPYLCETFSDNVHIFRSPEISCFHLPDIGADVYGFARCPQEEKPGGAPLDGFSVTDRNVLNIFCAYTALAGTEAPAPTENDTTAPIVTKEQLVRAGFDYAALGSVHNAGCLRRTGIGRSVTYFAYSGCPEGRSFDEPGPKSVIRASLSKEPGTPAELRVSRLRFTRQHYETLDVNLAGCMNLKSAADTISRAMTDAEYGKDTVLRLTLTGDVGAQLVLTPELLRPLLPPVAGLAVCDRTSPDRDAERLADDPTLRGAFYAELLPLLRNENEKDTARLALRLGLAALENTGTR